MSVSPGQAQGGIDDAAGGVPVEEEVVAAGHPPGSQAVHPRLGDGHPGIDQLLEDLRADVGAELGDDQADPGPVVGGERIARAVEEGYGPAGGRIGQVDEVRLAEP